MKPSPALALGHEVAQPVLHRRGVAALGRQIKSTLDLRIEVGASCLDLGGLSRGLYLTRATPR
jgi:hypothetical protein